MTNGTSTDVPFTDALCKRMKTKSQNINIKLLRHREFPKCSIYSTVSKLCKLLEYCCRVVIPDIFLKIKLLKVAFGKNSSSY